MAEEGKVTYTFPACEKHVETTLEVLSQTTTRTSRDASCDYMGSYYIAKDLKTAQKYLLRIIEPQFIDRYRSEEVSMYEEAQLYSFRNMLKPDMETYGAVIPPVIDDDGRVAAKKSKCMDPGDDERASEVALVLAYRGDFTFGDDLNSVAKRDHGKSRRGLLNRDMYDMFCRVFINLFEFAHTRGYVLCTVKLRTVFIKNGTVWFTCLPKVAQLPEHNINDHRRHDWPNVSHTSPWLSPESRKLLADDAVIFGYIVGFLFSGSRPYQVVDHGRANNNANADAADDDNMNQQRVPMLVKSIVFPYLDEYPRIEALVSQFTSLEVRKRPVIRHQELEDSLFAR